MDHAALVEVSGSGRGSFAAAQTFETVCCHQLQGNYKDRGRVYAYIVLNISSNNNTTTVHVHGFVYKYAFLTSKLGQDASTLVTGPYHYYCLLWLAWHCTCTLHRAAATGQSVSWR